MCFTSAPNVRRCVAVSMCSRSAVRIGHRESERVVRRENVRVHCEASRSRNSAAGNCEHCESVGLLECAVLRRLQRDEAELLRLSGRQRGQRPVRRRRRGLLRGEHNCGNRQSVTVRDNASSLRERRWHRDRRHRLALRAGPVPIYTIQASSTPVRARTRRTVWPPDPYAAGAYRSAPNRSVSSCIDTYVLC